MLLLYDLETYLSLIVVSYDIMILKLNITIKRTIEVKSTF